MANITKPAITMLPVEDIAEELKVIYNFSTTDQKANDVLKVAGEDASKVAIAYTNAAGVVTEGRDTVRNSMFLDNYPAKDYIRQEQAEEIKNHSLETNEVLSSEVASLRDELYQLRHQLLKQGFINDADLYQGYQDLFDNGNEKYLKDVISGIKSDVMGVAVTTIEPLFPNEFSIGDTFILHKKNDPLNNYQDTNYICNVTEKNGNKITFNPPVSDLIAKETFLYKSLGQYNERSFSFSKINRNEITPNVRYAMLNDDSYTKTLSIKRSDSGFGALFRVPEDSVGALKEFTIKAKAVGSPGALISYIIKKSDIDKYKNVIEAKSAGRIIGESNPISASAADRNITKLSFNYKVPPESAKVPILANEDYCFIIQTPSANDENYWEVLFCYSGDTNGNASDLQKNNKTYYFDAVNSNSSDKALTTTDDLSKYDLYFILSTNEIADYNEEAFTRGLYSTKINLAPNTDIARARLMLRVKREGLYKVASDSKVYTNDSAFSIEKESGNYGFSSESGIATSEFIVVGENIRQVKNTNNRAIYLKEGALINKNDKVYRVGYTVHLKAYHEEYDFSTGKKIITNEQKIEMPLIGVMKDSYYKNIEISDRLIFEGETSKDDLNRSKLVNRLELQIEWRSNFNASDIRNYPELAGKIFDLSLSLDKTL